MLLVDSRSMKGRYVCVACRLSAVAAALRAFFIESLHGEVPIVKTPCVFETTPWNVQKRGREISADWFLIHNSLTESKELA